MPIVNLLLRRMLQAWEVDAGAYVGEDPRRGPREEGQEGPANECNHGDVVRGCPVPQALQPLEGVVRLGLAKRVHRVDAVPVLKAVLDEAFALAYHGALPLILEDHCILEATRNEANGLTPRHQVFESLGVAPLDGAILGLVSTAEHLEGGVLPPEARIDEPADPPSGAHELRVEGPVDGPAGGEAAVRVEGEEAPARTDALQSPAELRLLVEVLGPLHQPVDELRSLRKVAPTTHHGQGGNHTS
mmetsp:Transcript_61213/g.137934  ORF Transcript_61213/g.137934 Transcript_61213/m.137934 type:complete len:245 (+) Transcript_61213:162-896(+)